MIVKNVRYQGSCPHCASLDSVAKGQSRLCRDCGAVFHGSEVLTPGYVDLHYSLEVHSGEGCRLWENTLDTLFEAQCDVAAGLGIPPGSSFTKWLKSRERVEGIIDDAETITTMQRIVSKLMKHQRFIRDPYNLDSIRRLKDALPRATRLCLTLGRRS